MTAREEIAVMPDPSTEFGGRVARRLAAEQIAWLTVVDRAGRPQPAPVWFLWTADSALVYSHHEAKRLEHLRANPHASLHLDGNGTGGDIVVLTGTIADAPAEPSVPDNPAYLDKYGEQITGGWGTAEEFATQFSIPLRFRPDKVRGH